MDILSCFKYLFETILDSTKVVLIIFSIKNDNDLLEECEF